MLFVGNLTKIPTCEKPKKQRKHTSKKSIKRTRQYLCGSAICLHSRSCRDFTIIREEYRVQHAATIFSLHIKTRHRHHTKKTLITKGGSTKPNTPVFAFLNICDVDGGTFAHSQTLGFRAIIRDHVGRVEATLSKHFAAPLGMLETKVKAMEERVLFPWDVGI